ncbi:hypothetical protein FHT76_006888 [Rhizobium sp. BK176]|nr:hypothetical protein [Rhizobium sp. BK176]
MLTKLAGEELVWLSRKLLQKGLWLTHTGLCRFLLGRHGFFEVWQASDKIKEPAVFRLDLLRINGVEETGMSFLAAAALLR